MGSPVVWFEMQVPDIERAKEFYGLLFGWVFASFDDYDPDYWLISTEEGTVSGGIREAGNGTGRDAVTLYVQVENLRGAVESAVLLGATVEEDATMITPTAGSYAVLRDPTGCRFGLWSAE